MYNEISRQKYDSECPKALQMRIICPGAKALSEPLAHKANMYITRSVNGFFSNASVLFL